jgi:hypothetical protein
LLALLWGEILFHFIVNNFSNMRVVYGLGIWWVTLGLIATMVYPYISRDYVKQWSEETDEIEAELVENRSRARQVRFLLRYGREGE